MNWIGSYEQKRWSALNDAADRAYRAHRRRPRSTTADRINGLGDAASRLHRVFVHRKRALLAAVLEATRSQPC